MPPKDVKKAKKLFEKMKKEKEEKLREEAASKEGTPASASDVEAGSAGIDAKPSAHDHAEDKEDAGDAIVKDADQTSSSETVPVTDSETEQDKASEVEPVPTDLVETEHPEIQPTEASSETAQIKNEPKAEVNKVQSETEQIKDEPEAEPIAASFENEQAKFELKTEPKTEPIKPRSETEEAQVKLESEKPASAGSETKLADSDSSDTVPAQSSPVKIDSVEPSADADVPKSDDAKSVEDFEPKEIKPTVSPTTQKPSADLPQPTPITNDNSENQFGSSKPAEIDLSAELIASLQEENETLRLQNESLQRKISQLEGELELARRSDTEVSLSPTYVPEPANDFASRSSRARRSSFVEASLFDQPDNSQLVATEMEKWKGFQLDMRNWQNTCGIGPIVSL